MLVQGTWYGHHPPCISGVRALAPPKLRHNEDRCSERRGKTVQSENECHVPKSPKRLAASGR